MLRNVNWQKEGDFDKRGYESNLVRRVEYKNLNSDMKIASIILLGYADNDLRIALHVKTPFSVMTGENEKLFDSVIKPVIAQGFPHGGERTTSSYYLTFPNMQFLSSFLDAVSKVDPTVSEIAPEILSTFRPYCKEEPTIPGWVKVGSFAREVSYGGSLLHMESFHSTIPDSKIRKVDLMGYYNEVPRVSVEMDKNHYGELISQLLARGYDKPDSNENYLKYYRINVDSAAKLHDFLSVVGGMEKSFNIISDGVQKTLLDELQRIKDIKPEPDDKIGFLMYLQLMILKAQHEAQLAEQLDSLGVSENRASFFGKHDVKRKVVIAQEKPDLSDEEMANSAFGRESFKARRR